MFFFRNFAPLKQQLFQTTTPQPPVGPVRSSIFHLIPTAPTRAPTTRPPPPPAVTTSSAEAEADLAAEEEEDFGGAKPFIPTIANREKGVEEKDVEKEEEEESQTVRNR